MQTDCLCNQVLKEHIRRVVEEQGPITFAHFMDLALYHPAEGYYTAPGRDIGPAGDFYTSANVHPLFGTMLAAQLYEMWELLGRPRPFTIVEYGAGTGLLAGDILSALRDRWPLFLEAACYVIIEISANLVGIQKENLAARGLPGGKVKWLKSLADFGPGSSFLGCVLSNEVVDAFPVHRVKQVEGRLREIYVALAGHRFVELDGELSRPELADYFAQAGVQLAEGQEAEVNLAALAWLEEVATALRRGFVLTIDYGYEARELYGPRFPQGTLLGYRQHRPTVNPYQAIGRQDLTAHVDFSALRRKGQEVGLETIGFTTQMKFLLALGILEEADRWQGEQREDEDVLRAKLALKRLIMPGGMGEIFKVLIQHKNVANPYLKGLQEPW